MCSGELGNAITEGFAGWLKALMERGPKAQNSWIVAAHGHFEYQKPRKLWMRAERPTHRTARGRESIFRVGRRKTNGDGYDDFGKAVNDEWSGRESVMSAIGV